MGDLVVAAIILGVVVCLFILFRIFVLWYWRVTDCVELLMQINEKLGRLVERNTPGGT